MAENGAPMTLSTPGGTIEFNPRTPSEFWVEEADGLDGVPVRAPQEDAPQTDGALDFDYFDQGRHITLKGFLLTAPGLSVTAAMAQRNNMENALRVACRSIRRATGTFTYNPTGVSPRSWTVKCDIQPTFPGKTPKEFIVGFFAADPE